MITATDPTIITKTNVLVVDDRPEGLLALEAVLSCESYNLIKASSGREALYHALYNDFAVILLDVQMPDLDGFETANLLRQSPRSVQTPIIFVTAINKELRHIYQGYEMGAVDYVFKPLDSFVLKSKVQIFVELFNKNVQIQEQAVLLQKLERREREHQLAELRQESQRRYSNLADAIPHIVIKLQNNGKVEYYNQYWYNYTAMGINDKAEIEWRWVIHPKDLKKILIFWFRKKQYVRDFQAEVRIRQKEGSYRWHLLRFVAEVKNSKTVGWIVTGTDIDNIKTAGEKFQLLCEDLDRSNRELEQFAFVASHDLQEPLRIISTYIDLVLFKYKNTLDEGAKEFIKVARESSTRAQKLIDDLLEYARVGIKKKSYAQINFESVVEDAIANIALLVKERNAEIIRGPLPILIADYPQMVQLFQNLLTNSLKYCDKPPKIIINAEKSPGGWIFSIKDNGIGIAPEYYKKIFLIFQRLHLMDQYEGTGIGLAICKKIIERHRGRIWVESQPGEGSTFYFLIPEL